MKLKIDSLTIRNFKGLKNYTLALGGKSARIRGQNGSGKTSLADAVTWALTGLMSDGHTAEVNPLNRDGRVLSNDTSVKITFTLSDDQRMTFTRSTGDPKFVVNGEPASQIQYKGAVHSLTQGAAPYLLMPQNFCRLDWKVMRNVLILMSDISNSEVVKNFPELEEIAADLSKKTPDALLKAAKDRRKIVNSKLAAIPARLDELLRITPAPVDTAEIERRRDELVKILSERIAALKETEEAADAAAKAIEDFRWHTKRRAKVEGDRAKTENQLERMRNSLKNLQSEWRKLKAAESGICPTCGSIVPAKNLEEILDRLDATTEEGRATAAEIKKLEAALEDMTDEIVRLDAVIAENSDTTNLMKVIGAYRTALTDCDAAEDEIAALETQLKSAADTNSSRIAELKAEEKALAAELGALDRKIDHVETFVRRKAELLENDINAKFKFVRFRLFKTLKTSGDLAECCEPTLNGVPYGTGLSKGERLKADLDILCVLQKFFDVEMPVFIDDSESYTSNSTVKIPNQIIWLTAAEGVKSLQVETEGV